MKQLFTTLLCAIAAFAVAQPTINSSWVPSTGQQTRITYFNTLTSTSQGMSGSAVTWNLSGIDTTGSIIQSFIAPSSISVISNFPGATDCGIDGNGDYTFDKLSGNIYQLIGNLNIGPGDTNYTIFSNPLDILHFPVTFNSSFSDAAQDKQVPSPSPDTTIEHTSETVTADGYGTLITKAGTYTNVLRIHVAAVSVDSTFMSGVFNSEDSIMTDTYFWISPANQGVILANISHTIEDGFPTDLGYYSNITPGVNGINTINDISKWSVAPQPATGIAKVILYSTKNITAAISIYDMTGRAVSNVPANLNANRNEIGIDVSALANGIYTISVTIEGETSAQKLVVRN